MDDRTIEAWLGGQVRSLRHQRDLTQDQLAERSGLSIDAIRRIERGAFSASLNTLRKLTDGLGVSLATLFETLRHDRADVVQVCDFVSSLSPEQVSVIWRVLRAMFVDSHKLTGRANRTSRRARRR